MKVDANQHPFNAPWSTENFAVTVTRLLQERFYTTLHIRLNLDCLLNFRTLISFSRQPTRKSGWAAITLAEVSFGKLNIMFNNAGIMHPNDDDAVTTDEAVWDKVDFFHSRNAFDSKLTLFVDLSS